MVKNGWKEILRCAQHDKTVYVVNKNNLNKKAGLIYSTLLLYILQVAQYQ